MTEATVDRYFERAWTGGELLPPRPERTSPIYEVGYLYGDLPRVTHERCGRVATRKPEKLISVRCAVCGRRIVRTVKDQRKSAAAGYLPTCSLPRKCRYRLSAMVRRRTSSAETRGRKAC